MSFQGIHRRLVGVEAGWYGERRKGAAGVSCLLVTLEMEVTLGGR